jgi:hypothetical protein
MAKLTVGTTGKKRLLTSTVIKTKNLSVARMILIYFHDLHVECDFQSGQIYNYNTISDFCTCRLHGVAGLGMGNRLHLNQPGKAAMCKDGIARLVAIPGLL